MKRFFTFILILSLVLSLCACKKKEPEMPPPATTESIETETPIVSPTIQEIVPEIEDIPTMPAAIPDNTPGVELVEIYAQFLYNYDWDQYNGFISTAPAAEFTYILSNDAEFIETKLLSEDYEGAITDRLVEYSHGTTLERFSMSDAGSFMETLTINEFSMIRSWNLINDNSITKYDHTELQDGYMYDLIYFYTALEKDSVDTDTPDIYVVQSNSSDEIFMIYFAEGNWHTNASWASGYEEKDIQFDTSSYTVTLPNKTISTTLLQLVKGEDADNSSEEELDFIEGYMYVNRTTQRVDYMYDSWRNTKITFITATPSFTTPSLYNEGAAPDLKTVSEYYYRFSQDLVRYFG